MKYLFYLLVICLLSIGCNTEENRLKEKQQKTETLKSKIENFKKIGDYESALEVCGELIYLDSSVAENYDSRSVIYEYLYKLDTTNKKLRELAYKDASKAILINPNCLRYLRRGEVSDRLFQEKNLTIKDYNLAFDLAEEPNDKARILNRRAVFYFSVLKDSLNSFRDFESSKALIGIEPNLKYHTKEYYSHCLMKCRLFQRAETILMELIENDVANSEPFYEEFPFYEDLIYCRIEQRNYLGALIIIESINLPLKFKNHHKGYCLYKTGNVSEGKKLMMEYKEPFPGPPYKGKKFNTSKYFLEVFPEYKSDTYVVTPKWDWPNDTQVED